MQSNQKNEPQENTHVTTSTSLDDELTPLVADLEAAGVSSSQELLSGITDHAMYVLAVPILAQHLTKRYSPYAKQLMIFSLHDKRASGIVNQQLLSIIESDPRGWLGARAAITYGFIARPDDYERAFEIAHSPDYSSKVRAGMIEAMGSARRSESIPDLIPFLEDEELFLVTATVLGNLRAIEAEDQIRRYSDHEHSYVRQEIKKALGKIETAKKRLAKKRLKK